VFPLMEDYSTIRRFRQGKPIGGPSRRGWARAAVRLGVLTLLAALTLGTAAPARAVELCSAEAKGLMREAGITEAQIERLCRLARQAGALLALDVRRLTDELGYCRVTLALHNNSLEYINSVALTSAKGYFEIFRFYDILPGGTGYASANSRILLACDELAQIKLVFHWPASMRVADESLQGARLNHYKPVLKSPLLGWNR